LQEYAPERYRIEEHFWVNREVERLVPDGLLYCQAYGECLWQKGGSFTSQRNHSFEKNIRSFEYIIEGEAHVQYEDHIYHLQAGDLFMCGPTEVIRSVDKKGFFKKRVAIFSGELVHSLRNLNQKLSTGIVHVENRKRVDQIYDSIKDHVVNGSRSLIGDLNVLGFSLFSEVILLMEVEKYPSSLRRILEFITDHLDSNLQLEVLSQEFHCSTSTLNRLFQKHLKKSPVDYIVSRRLERARYLMKRSELSIKEIANQCGYKSESFFSRAFKGRYESSPNEYRKLLFDRGKIRK